VKPIDAAGFERLFRTTSDPWNYRNSPFEAYKRRVLLRACGSRLYGRGLELACANGETTLRLHRRCLRLMAVDSSQTAVTAAGRRLGDVESVTLAVRLLPAEMPRGPFDLIVVSELIYYLTPNAMRLLADLIESALAHGGRVAVLHHLRRFDDAAQMPSLAQAALRRKLAQSMKLVFAERHGRFEAVAFEANRRRRQAAAATFRS
jgi:SAM-dependent methyltransferase